MHFMDRQYDYLTVSEFMDQNLTGIILETVSRTNEIENATIAL